MRILITDLHAASNRGDGAILEGMLLLLAEEFPTAEVLVLTDYPDAAERLHEVRVARQPFTSFSWRFVGRAMAMAYLLLAAVVSRKFGLSLPFLRHPSLKPYLEADLVLSKGGGFFSDYYWPAFVGRAWGLAFPKLLGKPVVLFGQSIGPLRRNLSRRLAGALFRSLDLLIVRDGMSRTCLEGLGVSGSRIVDGVDAAFALPHGEPADEGLLGPEGVDLGGGREWVSISVRRWPYMSDPDGHTRFVASIAALVDWLVEEEDKHVLFASTCTNLAAYHTDDRACASEILKQASPQAAARSAILMGEFSAHQLSRIYGAMELHVGTRLHSNILAMLSGTPVVGIGYEFKTREIFGTLDMGDLVLPIEGVDPTSLIALVERALGEEEALRLRLRGEIDGFRRQAREMTSRVRRMLEELSDSRGKGL